MYLLKFTVEPTAQLATRIVDIGPLMPRQLDAISIWSLTGMSA